ncbi:hypothetical protein [Ammoniphilus sp. CFH 90114]|uniref:hypothetical protein n=1 Tax=Ammoniphilus sp. CFH 90114 TaxID=2493665 RepID=UPI00100EC570|nr:hypothetical protein [Ammoniphilus sp. CFH 90114]RXT06955.1 hypothetical protein EIZ39_12385 [Ammoniphilus sp. CFH 90114]
MLRLITRFLKAGVIESGEYSTTNEGTPQGVSPILANVYLHYALDLWFEKAYAKAVVEKRTWCDMLMTLSAVFSLKRPKFSTRLYL